MRPMPAFGDLADAIAVFTGAGSGIGRATARVFADRGACVVVSDVDPARADEVAREIAAEGGSAVATVCDVASMSDLERLRDVALDAFGRVDIVMNTVGVIVVGPPEQIPLEEWERVIDLNLLGMVRSNAAFLPLLIEQGRGHVVNTGSRWGLLAFGYERLPYVATKHAVVGMSEALAFYLAPKGIGVTCLCPSGVHTNITELVRVVGDPVAPLSARSTTAASAVLAAEVVGEMVADAVEHGRFLVLTDPGVQDEVIEHATDLDAYIARRLVADDIGGTTAP